MVLSARPPRVKSRRPSADRPGAAGTALLRLGRRKGHARSVRPSGHDRAPLKPPNSKTILFGALRIYALPVAARSVCCMHVQRHLWGTKKQEGKVADPPQLCSGPRLSQRVARWPLLNTAERFKLRPSSPPSSKLRGHRSNFGRRSERRGTNLSAGPLERRRRALLFPSQVAAGCFGGWGPAGTLRRTPDAIVRPRRCCCPCLLGGLWPRPAYEGCQRFVFFVHHPRPCLSAALLKPVGALPSSPPRPPRRCPRLTRCAWRYNGTLPKEHTVRPSLSSTGRQRSWACCLRYISPARSAGGPKGHPRGMGFFCLWALTALHGALSQRGPEGRAAALGALWTALTRSGGGACLRAAQG